MGIPFHITLFYNISIMCLCTIYLGKNCKCIFLSIFIAIKWYSHIWAYMVCLLRVQFFLTYFRPSHLQHCMQCRLVFYHAMMKLLYLDDPCFQYPWSIPNRTLGSKKCSSLPKYPYFFTVRCWSKLILGQLYNKICKQCGSCNTSIMWHYDYVTEGYIYIYIYIDQQRISQLLQMTSITITIITTVL